MPKRLSVKEVENLTSRVRSLADKLGLRDWDIRVDASFAAKRNAAEMHLVYGQKLGWLRVCKRFASLSASSQQQTLVHELLHCHLDGVETVVRNGGLDVVMGADAFAILSANINNAIEWAVDAIATEIAPLV